MALQTGTELAKWEKFFVEAGISTISAKAYAQTFTSEEITSDNLHILDRATLKELGIRTMGDILLILKLTQGLPVTRPSSASLTKPPAAKLPQLNSEMTPQQFRKFRVDWEVFTKMTNLPPEQTNIQLYSCADETVQNSIINTYPEFFTTNPGKLLDMLEALVTQKSNPMVHRISFSSISQNDNESMQSYLIRLQSEARDCNFICPNCNHDLSNIYIKDQFIRGLANDALQADMLAKTESLRTLEQNVNHAEAFEAAMRDQNKISGISDMAGFRMSAYRRHRKALNAPHPPNTRDPVEMRPQHKPCNGCGSYSHGGPGTGDRPRMCPAWGQTCNICGKQNHFGKVCRSKNKERGSIRSFQNEEAAIDALIAHVVFDPATDTYKLSNNNDREEVEATLIPFSPYPDPRQTRDIPAACPTKIKIYPDSGATICLGGLKHLRQMGLTEKNLIPSKKKVRTVGGFSLVCQGWLPVKFKIGIAHTKQALYICSKVQVLYFSKAACLDIGILPPCFPKPMTSPPSKICEAIRPDIQRHNIQNPAKTPKFDYPKTPPYPPNNSNIQKLKEWLLDNFATTVFNNSGKFPAMSGPPAHIHLKEGATPKAKHNPIPVPYHYKEEVKKALWDDVKRGIITPVPIGTPTDWCSTMVITAKKNGKPRRTVDYQHLNSQCKRETHYTSSPFQLSMQVPPNTKKTVLDATDGYHSIPLDEESQPLTTFITEWGRFMYIRMPQGYLASGDAYTRRYDEIIKEVPRKVKIVDDTLLFDNNIKEAFYHILDYLLLCEKNGIVLNKEKFQFCQDVVQFAGLQITSTGVTPSDSLLNAISNFPAPQNITDARSWFGLVNQVAWAYSLSPIMLPFRDLVKKDTHFMWNESLEKAFQQSKKVIVDLVKKGVTTFDINRVTCLAPDWSKDGMGFMLLQKHCKCPTKKAPVCCPDGWCIVFAGSRFCTDAERRYAPIEGEAAAIAWALEKCRIFVMGSPNVIVVTDHQPLTGILGDRDLSKVHNPRLFRLKEKCLRYSFSIQHCPGKWHKGPDTVSRNPVDTVEALINLCPTHPSSKDVHLSDKIDAAMEIATIQSTINADNNAAMTPDHIRASGRDDEIYTNLINTINQGFPSKRSTTEPNIRDFWEVRHRLSADRGLVLMDGRIVIPKSLRRKILHCLHAAHQGVDGMKARANDAIYWPGMNASIRNFRANCQTCTTIAPSQPREPITMTPAPEWPFQKIVMDIFHVGHIAYLACADRLTGWIILYHLKAGHATTSELMSICRQLFQTYGTPEEISTDGGPPFTSSIFQEFLHTWCVRHRLSSVAYPQSNGRAELAVKTAKRIVNGNTDSQGSLNNDKIAQAILQYRNTPIQGIGLSPAQILLHRRLRDFIPSQPKLYKPHAEWVAAAQRREEILYRRNAKIVERYNRYTHHLSPLQIGDIVIIQNPLNNRWKTTGKIVTVLPDRQYRIRVDGSGRVTLRNRRFLRKCEFKTTPTPIPSATPSAITSTTNAPLLYPDPPTSSGNNTHTAIETAIQTTLPRPQSSKIPRALSRLLPHNRPGLKE